MGQSLFNVGRKLTPEEWGELKAWRAANPELRWKRGELRADGKVFHQYDKRSTSSGEAWVTAEQHARYTSRGSARAKERYREDPAMISARTMKYYWDNRDACRARQLIYRRENPEKIASGAKEWIAQPENRKSRREYMRKYMAERPQRDPRFAAILRLRARHRGLACSDRAQDKEAAAYIAWQLARLGLGPEDLRLVQVDHVVPVSIAAGDPAAEAHVMRWENLVVVPSDFNLAKRGSLPSYGYLRYRDALVEEYLKVLT